MRTKPFGYVAALCLATPALWQALMFYSDASPVEPVT
jgi:hypothetical protein